MTTMRNSRGLLIISGVGLLVLVAVGSLWVITRAPGIVSAGTPAGTGALATAVLPTVVTPASTETPVTPERFSCDQLPSQEQALCMAHTPSPYVDGISAIKPTIAFTNAATATFTEADVRAYFAANPPMTTAGTPGTITKIAFLPVEEVNPLIHTTVPVAPGTLLCYVELQGPFNPGGGPPGSPLQPMQHMYVLFSATTGNLIGDGGL